MKLILLMFVFLLIPLTVARVEYTPSTDTICENGICTKTLYSGIRNVEEDGKWKRVEDARSLKGKGFNIKFLENDENYPLEVIDFNYTSITVKLKSKGVSFFNKDIPVRVWDKNETKAKQFEDDLKSGKKGSKGVKDYKEKMDKVVEDKVNFNLFKKEEVKTLNFGLGKVLDFGENSTTVILQDADSEVLEDTFVNSRYPDGNYDGHPSLRIELGFPPDNIISFIKYKISSIPSDSNIIDAFIRTNLTRNYLEDTEGFNISVHHLYNQTWKENLITWNNMPTDYNSTFTDTIKVYGGSHSLGYSLNFSVTNSVQIGLDSGNDNLSFILKGHEMVSYPTLNDYIQISSREAGGGDPALIITYEEGGCTESIVNSSWSDWTNETECRVNNTLVQERNLTEYDENFCGEYENVTYYESQEAECVYEYFSFDNCRNYTVSLLSSFSRSMTASSHAEIDTYFLNDTSAFNVNSEGLVTNATVLNELKTYSLNLSVNNSESSLISCIFKIEVTQGSTGSAPCLYTKLGFYNKELMKGLTLNHGGVNLC